MTYETAATFAQTWGLVLFVILFMAVVAYVVWPGNRQKFEKAARLPLDDQRGE